jgi:hypothetical protein
MQRRARRVNANRLLNLAQRLVVPAPLGVQRRQHRVHLQGRPRVGVLQPSSRVEIRDDKGAVPTGQRSRERFKACGELRSLVAVDTRELAVERQQGIEELIALGVGWMRKDEQCQHEYDDACPLTGAGRAAVGCRFSERAALD